MKKVVFICMQLILFVPFLYCQSAGDLEQQYRSLNQTIKKEQAVLDSLSGLMENMAKDIEREKKNSKPDQNKIINWMAHAVTVSNRIKEQERLLESIQSSAEDCRDRLESVYTARIDSLKQAAHMEKNHGNLKAIQNQILFWTERRVLVSPVVGTLTFDPQKVQDINLTGVSDPLDKKIIEDYLKKALTEIETHIEIIAATRKEFEEITDLRKRTVDFVNEANEQGRIGTITRSQLVASGGGTDISGNPLGPDYTTIQVRSVVGLIQQLNVGLAVTPTFQKSISSKSGMTQEEYINLLIQAEKQLKAYRVLVQKKLK